MQGASAPPQVPGRVERGLVTLALLKANYDAGRDYIGMFQPFINDVISRLQSPQFSLEEVQGAILEAHGLSIPLETLKTLLARGARRGALKREDGRYAKAAKFSPPTDILASRARIAAEHSIVADRFRDFAREHGLGIVSADDALSLVISFIGHNQACLVLGDVASLDSTLPEPAELSIKQSRAVALFLKDVCLRDPTLERAIERLLGGFVLQNALLLRDIGSVGKRFDNLQIILDAGLALTAVGLAGESIGKTVRDGLDVLRLGNAKLGIFEQTVLEMKRILHVYEIGLATPRGRERLRSSALTRHFFARGYRPSDVKQAMSMLESDLRLLGIRVMPLPKHDRRFTLDEAALARALQGPEQSIDSQRVTHDVDCAAAVLTLRAGRSARTWEECRVVFATTSSSVYRTVRAWYADAGERGVPPFVPVTTLTSIAWLKRPAAAPRLKLNELVELCSAALMPTRRMWDNFRRHLKTLTVEGKVTNDEAIAIIASELTQTRLDGEIDEHAVTEKTVAEIAESVKAEHKAEEVRKLADVEVRAESAVTRAAIAERRASELEADRRAVLQVNARATQIASTISYVVFGALWVAIAMGLWTGLDSWLSGFGSWGVVAGRVCAFAALVFGVLGTWKGFALDDLRQKTRMALERVVRKWLTGNT